MTKPKNCISEEKARELQDNWVATRAKEIERVQGPDQREVIYSIAELEEYLAYVKALSNEQGIKEPGIRIYFAAYNDDKSKLATAFLAPTKSSEINADNNYDIDPFNWGQGGWPPRNY